MRRTPGLEWRTAWTDPSPRSSARTASRWPRFRPGLTPYGSCLCRWCCSAPWSACPSSFCLIMFGLETTVLANYEKLVSEPVLRATRRVAAHRGGRHGDRAAIKPPHRLSAEGGVAPEDALPAADLRSLRRTYSSIPSVAWTAAVGLLCVVNQVLLMGLGRDPRTARPCRRSTSSPSRWCWCTCSLSIVPLYLRLDDPEPAARLRRPGRDAGGDVPARGRALGAGWAGSAYGFAADDRVLCDAASSGRAGRCSDIVAEQFGATFNLVLGAHASPCWAGATLW